MDYLGSLFLQGAAFAYLYVRDDTFDRRNLVLHAPVTLTFALSYFLSLTSPNVKNLNFSFKDPSLHNCNFFNRLLSYLMAMMFLFLPYWFNQVTRFDTKQHENDVVWDKQKAAVWQLAVGKSPKIVWNAIKLMSLATTITYYVSVLTLGYAYFIAGGREDAEQLCQSSNVPCNFVCQSDYCNEPIFAVCTTKGINGYQIWPFMTWSNIYLKYFLVLGYFGMCGSFQYLPRPTIVVHAYALAVYSLPIFVYYVDDQWGSMWLYWLSLIMYPIFLFEPKILIWSKVLDSSLLKRNNDSERRRGDASGFNAWWHGRWTTRQVVFHVIWSRFMVWHWHPWRDKTKELQEINEREEKFEKRVREEEAKIIAMPTKAEEAAAAVAAAEEAAAVACGEADPMLGNEKSTIDGMSRV